MILLLGLGVFLSATALDFAAARYNRAVRDDRLEIAARWTVVMCLLSTVGLLAVVDSSRWMVVPEAAGFYVGTRLSGFRSRQPASSEL